MQQFTGHFTVVYRVCHRFQSPLEFIGLVALYKELHLLQMSQQFGKCSVVYQAYSSSHQALQVTGPTTVYKPLGHYRVHRPL